MFCRGRKFVPLVLISSTFLLSTRILNFWCETSFSMMVTILELGLQLPQRSLTSVPTPTWNGQPQCILRFPHSFHILKLNGMNFPDNGTDNLWRKHGNFPFDFVIEFI
ncbi:hypothetical protein CDAR_564221 [Caerostris darwini]|uniref:Uncharacterized protein n=1 Tax=Caerostris darwini TaxID=1538125 RepID=A0AAV4VIQ5_9ARAC|nr:hypothetical protein CDAR_564221 [Caerostris darwini]